MIQSAEKNKEASLRQHFTVKPAKRTENCFAKHWCLKKKTQCQFTSIQQNQLIRASHLGILNSTLRQNQVIINVAIIISSHLIPHQIQGTLECNT